MTRLLITGATLADGTGADVLVEDGTIREVGTVSGFNINGGRPLSFRAYATIPEAPGR